MCVCVYTFASGVLLLGAGGSLFVCVCIYTFTGGVLVLGAGGVLCVRVPSLVECYFYMQEVFHMFVCLCARVCTLAGGVLLLGAGGVSSVPLSLLSLSDSDSELLSESLELPDSGPAAASSTALPPSSHSLPQDQTV